MNLDLHSTPVSSQTLGEIREACTHKLTIIKAKEKRFKIICYLVGMVGFLLCLIMWHLGYFNNIETAVVFVGAIAFAVASTVVGFLGVFAFAGVYYFYKHIDTPRNQMNNNLSMLIELEHSGSPDECICFFQWCKEDETLKAYQHQLVLLNRKPTMGEYLAAKQWIDESDKGLSTIQKQQQAKEACEAMGVPI